jgi:hypothetical protein
LHYTKNPPARKSKIEVHVLFSSPLVLPGSSSFKTGAGEALLVFFLSKEELCVKVLANGVVVINGVVTALVLAEITGVTEGVSVG